MKLIKAYPALRTIVRLNAERKRYGIENIAIAALASKRSKRGHVGITTVSNALTGMRKSMVVLEATRELIAEAKALQVPPSDDLVRAGSVDAEQAVEHALENGAAAFDQHRLLKVKTAMSSEQHARAGERTDASERDVSRVRKMPRRREQASA